MALSKIDVANMLTGTTPVANGGTGVTTGSGLVKLSTQTAAGDASITFDNTLITNTYDAYLLTFRDIDTATDSVSLNLFVSDDNGSSYKTSGVYKRVTGYGNHGHSDDSNIQKKAGAPSKIVLAGTALDVGSNDKETAAGHMWMYNLRKSDRGKCFFLSSTYEGDTEKGALNFGSVYLDDAMIVNNIKIEASSGNLTEGTFSLFGLVE
jgi:hypothetical protein